MNNPVKPFSFFIILLMAVPSYGQFLPLDALGKCEMADVVPVEGFTKLALYTNEVQWFNSLPRDDVKLNSIVKDSVEGKVSAHAEFLVYAQSGILRKVAGSVSYRISVEAKDGKYRYSFADFLYHYYAQNRNYQMVKTGKTKPLEETQANGWQKLWTQHRKTVFASVAHQINDLKVKIVETPKAANEKELKRVDW